MEFPDTLLNNRLFWVTDSCFDRGFVKSGAPDAFSAAQLMPNGDYHLRFEAKGAKTVDILPWFGDPTPEGYAPWRDRWIHAEETSEGVFEAILPWERNKTGPRNIEIYVDGVFVLWPYLPIFWSGGHMYNYLEVPDAELEFSYIRDVPHGAVTHEYYYSTETNQTERCLVYTPPEYAEHPEKRYPVLYLQHGGGENETVWVSTGRVNFILDNLLAEGKCEPFIVVMNNGMIRYPDTKPGVMDECFENSLIRCCIPHIERRYRVKADKWSRAIAGLSMGSMQTNDIGFKHPELFGNMGSFTSTMVHDSFKTTYERPWPRVMANPEQFMKDYKVFFCSATPQEDHMPLFLEDARVMREAGIEGVMPGYRRVIHDGRFIRWDSWRMGMAEFATMLFRD